MARMGKCSAGYRGDKFAHCTARCKLPCTVAAWPWASLSLSADVQLHVLNNRYDRRHLWAPASVEARGRRAPWEERHGCFDAGERWGGRLGGCLRNHAADGICG
jgi:hypothetical protein